MQPYPKAPRWSSTSVHPSCVGSQLSQHSVYCKPLGSSRRHSQPSGSRAKADADQMCVRSKLAAADRDLSRRRCTTHSQVQSRGRARVPSVRFNVESVCWRGDKPQIMLIWGFFHGSGKLQVVSIYLKTTDANCEAGWLSQLQLWQSTNIYGANCIHLPSDLSYFISKFDFKAVDLWRVSSPVRVSTKHLNERIECRRRTGGWSAVSLCVSVTLYTRGQRREIAPSHKFSPSLLARKKKNQNTEWARRVWEQAERESWERERRHQRGEGAKIFFFSRLRQKSLIKLAWSVKVGNACGIGIRLMSNKMQGVGVMWRGEKLNRQCDSGL